MALVTNTVLKEYLPEIQGTGADSELTALIGRVESAIANYLGFPIADSASAPSLDSATYTIYLDGPTYSDNLNLNIPLRPLSSITSIHTDPDQEYGSDTLIAASTYTIDLNLGRVYLKPNSATKVFDYGFRAIKVICVAGYSSGTAPGGLLHAICVWASQMQRNKTAQGKETISQRTGNITLSPKSIPLEVKEMLYPFRNFGSIL